MPADGQRYFVPFAGTSLSACLRSARGKRRQPGFKVFRPIADQGADLDELWPPSRKPPSSQRCNAHVELLRNFVFSQECKHFSPRHPTGVRICSIRAQRTIREPTVCPIPRLEL